VQLPLAQALFGVPDRVTGLEVSVKNPYNIRPQKEALVEKLGFAYWVRSWQDLNQTFFAALRHEKAIMAIILFLILCVAAFNIASTLIMVVMDKAKDIGILKSIGMTSSRVQLIFFIQGLIVACVGLVLGNLGGWWLSAQLNAIVEFFEKHFGIGLFPSDIYYFKDIPVLISPSEVLAINAFAVVVALVAAWYPAWYASRLSPVESLRYE